MATITLTPQDALYDTGTKNLRDDTVTASPPDSQILTPLEALADSGDWETPTPVANFAIVLSDGITSDSNYTVTEDGSASYVESTADGSSVILKLKPGLHPAGANRLVLWVGGRGPDTAQASEAEILVELLDSSNTVWYKFPNTLVFPDSTDYAVYSIVSGEDVARYVPDWKDVRVRITKQNASTVRLTSLALQVEQTAKIQDLNQSEKAATSDLARVELSTGFGNKAAYLNESGGLFVADIAANGTLSDLTEVSLTATANLQSLSRDVVTVLVSNQRTYFINNNGNISSVRFNSNVTLSAEHVLSGTSEPEADAVERGYRNYIFGFDYVSSTDKVCYVYNNGTTEQLIYVDYEEPAIHRVVFTTAVKPSAKPWPLSLSKPSPRYATYLVYASLWAGSAADSDAIIIEIDVSDPVSPSFTTALFKPGKRYLHPYCYSVNSDVYLACVVENSSGPLESYIEVFKLDGSTWVRVSTHLLNRSSFLPDFSTNVKYYEPRLVGPDSEGRVYVFWSVGDADVGLNDSDYPYETYSLVCAGVVGSNLSAAVVQDGHRRDTANFAISPYLVSNDVGAMFLRSRSMGSRITDVSSATVSSEIRSVDLSDDFYQTSLFSRGNVNRLVRPVGATIASSVGSEPSLDTENS